MASAKGASWKRPNWPIDAQGELVSALDGQWPINEKALADKIKGKAAGKDGKGEVSAADLHRATQDSVRAIMMIRAYRMRGHLHANLDPLGLDPQKDHEELHPASYGFTEADYDRKIFIDHVLGMDYATIAKCSAFSGAPIATRSAGIHAYFRSRREGLDSGAHRRSDKEIHSPRRASAPSCKS